MLTLIPILLPHTVREEQWETLRGGQTTQKANTYISVVVGLLSQSRS